MVVFYSSLCDLLFYSLYALLSLLMSKNSLRLKKNFYFQLYFLSCHIIHSKFFYCKSLVFTLSLLWLFFLYWNWPPPFNKLSRLTIDSLVGILDEGTAISYVERGGQISTSFGVGWFIFGYRVVLSNGVGWLGFNVTYNCIANVSICLRLYNNEHFCIKYEMDKHYLHQI